MRSLNTNRWNLKELLFLLILVSLLQACCTPLLQEPGCARHLNDNNVITEPDWQTTSFGSYHLNISTAGDVNNDGYSDFIIGVPEYDNGEDELAGRVFVYYGSKTGLGIQQNWQKAAPPFGSKFGSSVGPAGDVNGDGYGEILVGATGDGTGAAFMFKGGSDGLPVSTYHTEKWFLPLVSDGKFGFAVGYAGDVNSDGFDDVLIGAPDFDYDLVPQNKGAVFAWYGRADWFEDSYVTTTSVADWQANGTQNDAHLGYSVTWIGSTGMFGDTYSDIAVGAPNSAASYVHHSNGSTTIPSHIGRTLIWRGGAAGLSTSSGSLPCCEPGKLFGTHVSTGGNLGVIDTAQAYTIVGGSNSHDYGSVRIGNRHYDGTADKRILLARTLGDIDGDGVADFGILSSVSGSHILEVYFGALLDNPPLTLANNVTDFVTAGDVNGDGYSDTAVIVNGEVQLFYGQPSAPYAVPFTTINDDITFVFDASAFGSAITARGDFNGDGYTDLVVGAPDSSTGYSSRAGVVSIYYGPLHHEFENRPSAGKTSYMEGAEMGRSLAVLDFDGDGIDDLAVGVPGWSNGDATPGAVYIYRGATSGALSQRIIISIDQDGARFGQSLVYAGDINNDGYGDLLVGAPGFDETITDEGAVFLYLGQADLTQLVNYDWYSVSGQAQSNYGWAVTGGRDFNGDGFEDIAVGAPNYDHLGADVGAVFLWFGDEPGPTGGSGTTGLGPSGDASLADKSMYGSQPGGQYGYALAFVGDLDQDTRSELVVGIPFHDGAQVNSGAFQVFFGTNLDINAVPPFEGDQLEGKLGYSIAEASDINGDGISDLLVSAPFYDTSTAGNNGKVYAWFGAVNRRDFSIESADWTMTGAPESLSGMAIGGGGDVTSGGIDDVIIGAPSISGDEGTVSVYSNSLSANRYIDQAHLDTSYRLQLHAQSDSTGGIRLRGKSQHPAGRLAYTVDYKVDPFASESAGSVLDSQIHNGTTSSVDYWLDHFESVLIPTAGVYRWSARFNYNNPYFPWSPWLTAPGANHTEGAFYIHPTTSSSIKALFTAQAVSASGALEYRFDSAGTFSDYANITEYRWEFGDGEIDTGAVVIHQFPKPGFYDVSLRVADADGYVSDARKTIKVLPDDAVRLSFVPIDGLTGGNPAITKIFRADLSNLGLAELRSIVIFDRSQQLSSAFGKWTGMDVDALSVLNQQCGDVNCVLQNQSLSNFDASFTYFIPGEQKPPVEGILQGTMEDGLEVEHDDASFNLFDADGVTTGSDGFISLGDGGVLSFSLESSIPINGTFLYLGEVSDNGEIPNAQIYASARSLPPKGISVLLNNEQRFVIGSNFSFYLPQGALSQEQRVQFIEKTDPSGGYRLIIHPKLTYLKPALVFIGGETVPPMKLSVDPPAELLSTSVAGGQLFEIKSQSTYGTGRSSTPCPGGKQNCTIQEFNGSGPEGQAMCLHFAFVRFNSWLTDIGFESDPEHDALGITKARCKYTAQVDSMISVTPVGSPYLCAAITGTYCHTYQISIPQHQPTVESKVYLPSNTYLKSQFNCASEGSAVDSLYNDILQHELTHVDINNTPVIMDPIVKYRDQVPDGYDLTLLKSEVYKEWCIQNVRPKLEDMHNEFHSIEPEPTFEAFSPACGWCNFPDLADEPQAAYCPCNDPSQGKPRYYDSAIECAVNCPSGLACFASLCRVPAE